MSDSKTPSRGPFEDTESINVTSLVTEVTSSASFDVRQFRTTSFSRLLQALPVPALLIDESHLTIFANRACDKIDPDPEKLLGVSAAKMAHSPGASQKIRLLLEEVLSTRKPRTCEAALGAAKTSMWGRLFFRSVRLEENRLILLVVEDLTLEKKQLLLSQRHQEELEKEIAERTRAEEALEKANRELEDRIRQRTGELLELNEKLETEIRDRERAQELLSESQQRLELALKGADLGLWDYDIANAAAFVDQRWADIFGYSLDDIQPTISWWRTVIHPDDRPAVIEAWNAHMAGRTDFFEAEHRVKTKPGEWVWVLNRGKVVDRDREGNPLRASGTVSNISDRKRAEEMLRSKTDALERSNRDLEEFAYVAAHDLREPLVGIAAYLKVLERRCKDRLDSEAHEFVSRALTITLRMDTLVQSLLAYSRLGAGPKSFQPTDCDAALHSALSNLRSAIEESAAQVTTDPLPTVMGDAALMVQLFQNLISNAMKFASDRPLRIHVGAIREASGWKFSVRDNGIGIEAPHFDRIFRIFQRVEASGERMGTGIGLANCKKIVEHHGGRIWVESQPGGGSTFFFTVSEWVGGPV